MPTPTFEVELNAHRERFQICDAWLAPLVAWLEEDAPTEFSTHQALTEGIGLSVGSTLRRNAEMRVSTLLTQLGYVRGPRRRKKGERIRTWRKGGA